MTSVCNAKTIPGGKSNAVQSVPFWGVLIGTYKHLINIRSFQLIPASTLTANYQVPGWCHHRQQRSQTLCLD